MLTSWAPAGGAREAFPTPGRTHTHTHIYIYISFWKKSNLKKIEMCLILKVEITMWNIALERHVL
jgi:hypothetical protein